MKLLAAIVVMLAIIAVLGVGCESKDDRYRELVQETTRQQAEQNRRMAEVQTQATATVQAGIEANREERRAIDAQREDVREQMSRLDDERREIASERQWDSKCTSALLSVATLLAALAPLLLAGYCLRKSCSAESHEEAVREIIIEEAAEAVRLQKQSEAGMQPLAAPQLKRLKS